MIERLLPWLLRWMWPEFSVEEALSQLNREPDITAFLRNEVGLHTDRSGGPVERWLRQVTKTKVSLTETLATYDDGHLIGTYVPIGVGQFIRDHRREPIPRLVGNSGVDHRFVRAL